MAETLLSFGVEKLSNLLVRESERFQGVKEQSNGLKSDLNMLRCFLEDADAKKHTSAMMRNTINEIKEIVCDAEDIIETFFLKEELGNTSGIRSCVRRFSCVILERKGFAFDMEVISKRISKVIRDMQSLGVQQVIFNEDTQSIQERQRKLRQTFSNDNETVFVGLEENVQKLVGYLVEEGSSSQVVSITGMGGIGKTTLARQVFNDETIKSHFAGFAWVCVSQQFTREYVWRTILQKLRPGCEVSKMTEEELQEKLFQVLETQKALVVLDDIWREEDWDMIKPMFPRKKGWKVVVTSRNEGVALRADPTCFTLKPVCLTLEKSWTLFRKIAFRTENTTEHKVVEEMEEMGKKMIKHCGGLPLAIKVLGGLLAAQCTLHEWKMINENIGSYIIGGTTFSGQNIDSVYYILSLSFEELPIYLKHCFLYLAHFPEDCSVNVENLSYYWAGEGIQRPRYYDGASIREVGDGYIQELVKRNMVISERDMLTSRYETCQLHDMMREVCLRKAEEENFLQIVDTSTVTTPTANSQSPSKSRRMVIDSCDHTFHIKNPKLRSLLMLESNSMASRLCYTKLQLMRVLDLSWVEFEGGKVPSSIGKLIHLRYLSLFGAYVTHLPSSLRNLKLLLFLNLGVEMEAVALFKPWGSTIYMPNILKEMQELTYLYLPEGLDDKVKIELANLVNLETLENFSTKHGSVSDLQGMTRLETLSIIFSGGCSVESLNSSLSELRHLENLTINNKRAVDTRGFVLDCVDLKHLKLSIHMPRLLAEKHLSSHLTTIDLNHCCLEEDPMPILAKMFNLKEVRLWPRSFCGRRMICSVGWFPQLRKLVVCGLWDWEEWIVEEGSMPLLHDLSINHCEKLKELPHGLPFITSLVELRMDKEWKKRVSEGGEDYYKVQHISCVTFPWS